MTSAGTSDFFPDFLGRIVDGKEPVPPYRSNQSWRTLSELLTKALALGLPLDNVEAYSNML